MILNNNFPAPPKEIAQLPEFSDAIVIDIMDGSGNKRQMALLLNGADGYFGYDQTFTKVEQFVAELGVVLKSDETIIGYAPTRYRLENGQWVKGTTWCPVSTKRDVVFGHTDI